MGYIEGKSDFLIEAISKEIQTEHLFASKHRSAHSSIKSILAGVLALSGLFNLSSQILISFKFLRANFKQLAYAFLLSFNRHFFFLLSAS